MNVQVKWKQREINQKLISHNDYLSFCDFTEVISLSYLQIWKGS